MTRSPHELLSDLYLVLWENPPEWYHSSDLIAEIDDYFKAHEEEQRAFAKLPCHVCGVLLSVAELDENAAYTYPEQKPYCPAHAPKEN